MAEELTFFPDAKVQLKKQENPIRSITNPPTEIGKINTEHLQRHWEMPTETKDVFLGSRFEPNEAFKNAAELTDFLQQAAEQLIPADEHDRRHIFTLSLPYPIGRTAVVEISDNDTVIQKTRDAGGKGEAIVNTVVRDELPETNLITFDVKPVFPPKGVTAPLTFEIASAFPGEPAPRLITKARIQNHEQKPQKDPSFDEDKAYWDQHAFIQLK